MPDADPPQSERPVYLDYAATTPIHPAVLAAMEPWLRSEFGNPSSLYSFGRRAASAVTAARDTVAAVLGCQPDEVIFTGGGSEADNLALRGAWQAQAAHGRRHIIVSAIEHSAVLETVASLRRWQGAEVSVVSVGPSGVADAAAILDAVHDRTGLISLMAVNNELGTIQPVAELAGSLRQRGILLHCDAVQAAGQLSLRVDELGVDLLSLSAHKCYGPKGVGVLYARRGTDLVPQLTGGDQESGHRAGTENVAGIVGAATAFDLVERHRPSHVQRLTALRQRLETGLVASLPGIVVNGASSPRTGSISSISFIDVQAETLLIELDQVGIAVSSGSACHAGSTDPSHVLLAIGLPAEIAHTTLRFSLGAPTTDDDITRTIGAAQHAYHRVRSLVS